MGCICPQNVEEDLRVVVTVVTILWEWSTVEGQPELMDKVNLGKSRIDEYLYWCSDKFKRELEIRLLWADIKSLEPSMNIKTLNVCLKTYYMVSLPLVLTSL